MTATELLNAVKNRFSVLLVGDIQQRQLLVDAFRKECGITLNLEDNL